MMGYAFWASGTVAGCANLSVVLCNTVLQTVTERMPRAGLAPFRPHKADPDGPLNVFLCDVHPGKRWANSSGVMRRVLRLRSGAIWLTPSRWASERPSVQSLFDRGQGEPPFLEVINQPETVAVPGVVVTHPALAPRGGSCPLFW